MASRIDAFFTKPSLDLEAVLAGPSVWDPETLKEEDIELAVQGVGPETIRGESVRALFLELIRRAAHDWVLYKVSSRLEYQELAHDAYVWLFEEELGHPNWAIREREGKSLTSLISLCSLLDIDVEYVRTHVRRLTPQKIKTAGRPPERRRGIVSDGNYYNEHRITTAFEFPAEE